MLPINVFIKYVVNRHPYPFAIFLAWSGVRVVVFNATFQQYFSYIVAVRFIGDGNRSSRRNLPNLPQVTDKLYHIIMYRVDLAWAFELTTLVAICADYIGSCNSIYHTITTTTTTDPSVWHTWGTWHYLFNIWSIIEIFDPIDFKTLCTN